ncbi:hypothetical protein ACLB0R_09480 [Sphingomonas sp. GlSt437]|uniref:hypothetical protein n=1 Tax=Sphingomonas sp. GlSt437 TaxID=3389970 RepID=UPI003A89D3F1
MSTVGDAFSALKNVMLMQERIDGLRSDIRTVADDLRTVTSKVGNINERVIRIETMIEMTRSGQGGATPRIEG